METFITESTESSPGVILDPNKNEIEFIGESRPEDTRKFFAPIIDWLNQYKSQLKSKVDGGSSVDVKCNFKLQYFNSSSAKFFMDILNLLKEIKDLSPKINISVNWNYYEFDEDMKEAGEEFEKLTGITFNLLPYGDE